MSAPLFSIVEGWTGPLPLTVRGSDGVVVDLLGLTVSGVLHDSTGGLVFDTTGRIAVTNSTAGQLELRPTAGDFLAAKTPYRFRVRVTDSIGKSVYIPHDDAALIEVNVP